VNDSKFRVSVVVKETESCDNLVFHDKEGWISHSFVRVIKSRIMRLAGHVAPMGDRRGVYRVLVGKPEGKNHLGDPDVDGRVMLRWIFRK